MKQLHRNIASDISQHVLNGISHVTDNDFTRLVNQLLWAERIFVHGSGRSGLIGRMFAMRLVHLGKQVFVVGQTTTPPIAEGDVLLVISGSGRTSTAKMYAQQAKAFKAIIVALSLPCECESQHHVRHYSDLCITVDPHLTKDDLNKSLNLLPLGTGFEISALFLLESVIVVLMQQQQMSEEDLRQKHANLE